MSPTMLARRPGALRRALAVLAQRPARSAALPTCAVALGLLVAAFGLFRPAPPRLTAVPPGYVALVNQKGILLSDFIAQTQSETGAPFTETTPSERQRVLHEMVDEELLVQRGLVLDLPETTTEVRDIMASAVNAQVDAPLAAITPTDAELHAFYDTHRAKYTTGGTMTVHDLVLHVGGYEDADQSLAQAQTDAADAVYQLRSGASIDYVKEHYGFVDSGRVDNTEELDFAAKLHLGAKLYEAAGMLSDGEVSDPIVDTDGVHVLVMDHRQPPNVADFSTARNQVYSDYRDAQNRRGREQNLKILRSEAQILIAPGESE
ncbi:MAG TPA: peptidylprolyl isomerase [Steroidobacteraceae bacterium]|nr:peptidylprolyl isomerase [Steroidobacteraceae bacterium]